MFRKKVSSAVILVTILSSCAQPNSTFNSQAIMNQEQNNKQDEGFNIKARKIKPSVNPSPTPVPTVIPTLAPTAIPFTGNRIISFSGYDWLVRNTSGTAGPGPNRFSNSTDNVYVDSTGQLHLKITQRDGLWYCASIGALKSLGYGQYKFYISSRLDQLSKDVVAGLFTWDDDPAYNHREIDIEFSKWGNESNSNSQYTVQPYDKATNFSKFNTLLSGDYSTHSFNWTQKKISFESYFGHYNVLPSVDFLIHSWSYTGSDIPLKGNEKTAINLWMFNGVTPTQESELIIKKFEFIPETTVYTSN